METIKIKPMMWVNIVVYVVVQMLLAETVLSERISLPLRAVLWCCPGCVEGRAAPPLRARPAAAHLSHLSPRINWDCVDIWG